MNTEIDNSTSEDIDLSIESGEIIPAKEVHTTTPRSVDTTVTVLELEVSVEGMKWAVRCNEHMWMVFTETRRAAHLEAGHVDEWCADCAND